VLKHTWKAEEGEDSIKVSEDPALQEKALAEGRLLRKTLYKQFEEDIDLHRKTKIRKLQELKTEKEKILENQLSKRLLLPMPTQAVLDPKVHFNSSISKLKYENPKLAKASGRQERSALPRV